MDTLADMLQSPRFATEVFEREKARAIANAAEAETQPDHSRREAPVRAHVSVAPLRARAQRPPRSPTITREDVERHYRSALRVRVVPRWRSSAT